MKSAITKTTKTKKAAIPAAIERAIARAIAKNETEKAAAIAEASRLMKLGVVIKAALRVFLWFLPRSCVSDLCLRPVFRQVGDCLRPVLR